MQFEPASKAIPPYVIHLDEKTGHEAERARNHDLCRDLEVKLQGDTPKKKKKVRRLSLQYDLLLMYSVKLVAQASRDNDQR